MTNQGHDPEDACSNNNATRQVNGDDICDILTEENVNNIVSKLIVSAPTEDVKNVLRVYVWGKSTRNIEKEMNRFGVQQLNLTSIHLNIDDGTQYLKHELINKIICRIQNLFPEKCDSCNEIYAMENSDPILLPCEKCGQEFHHKCLFQLLEIDQERANRDLVQERLNPMKIATLRYLCKTCDETTMPSKGSARKKKAPSEVNNNPKSSQKALPLQQQPEELPNSSTSVPHSPGLAALAARVSSAEDAEKEEEGDIAARANGNTTLEERKLCRFYVKGTCTHGVSGKNCAFAHPKACPKLLKHGTKAPRGCNLGKRCAMFHPKMCSSSIAKAECLKKDCKLKHVQGTKRSETLTTAPFKETTSETDTNNQLKKKKSPHESRNSDSFLEEVRLLKTGMERMENQMKFLMSQQMAGHYVAPQMAPQMSFPLPMMYPQQQMQYPGMPMLQHLPPIPQQPHQQQQPLAQQQQSLAHQRLQVMQQQHPPLNLQQQ